MGHYDNIRGVDEEYYSRQRDENLEFHSLLKDLASLLEGDTYSIMLHTQHLTLCNTVKDKNLYMRRIIKELEEEI